MPKSRSSLVVVAGAVLAACTGGSINPQGEALAPRATTTQQALGAAPVLDAAIARHSATLLGDGTVLVAGGLDVATTGEGDFPASPAPTRSARRYVSSEVGFETLPDLTVARSGHTATRLLDGSVFVAGGFDASGAALDSTELYDPVDALFIGGPEMPSARGDGTATLLVDGRVLLVGGHQDAEHVLPNARIELYDPQGQTFTTVGDPNHHGGTNVAVSLADGTVGIHWTTAGEPASVLFDPRTNRLTTPDPPLFGELPAASLVAATRLPTGALAAFDGFSFHLTDPSGRCADGQKLCDGTCVDVLANNENCGACGAACGSGTTCIDASCVCHDGGTYCAGTCTNPSSDPSHCGSCAHACDSGEFCVSGECVSDCGNDYLKACNGTCVDPYYDSNNCGGCGLDCGDGPAWACNGACYCPSTLCGSSCTYLNSDPEHCGSCTNRCADGEICLNGACTSDGCWSQCDGKCTSTAFDPKNCGGCGIQCSGSQVCQGSCQYCQAGTIRCPTEVTLLNGETFVAPTCVDPKTDWLHCGACETACPSGFCNNGTCAPPCPAGQALCGDPYAQQCQSIETDDNCGGCGQRCSAGLHCKSGTCALGSSDPAASLLVPALATGTVWATDGSVAVGLDAYALAHPGEVPTAGITTVLGAVAGTFGGGGHTTTTLPDGSLLAIGGQGTPSAWRLFPPWGNDLGLFWGQVTESYASVALTLADGRLLVTIGTSLYLYRSGNLEPFASVLPPGPGALGASLQPSGLVLLLLCDTPRAELFDPSEDTLKSLDVAFEFESTARGSTLPLPGGGMLVAGRDGVEMVGAAGSGNALGVRSLALELDCDPPALSRLANGHVAVVGNDTLYEVDVQSGRVAASVELLLPHCGAAIVARRDGSVLLVGGVDGTSGTPSTIAEVYDPSNGKVRRWSSGADSPPLGATARHWFDEPLLVDAWEAALVDWQSGMVVDASFAAPPGRTTHLTTAGTWFNITLGSDVQLQEAHRGPLREMQLEFPQAPTLRMHDAVDFETTFPGHPFPGNAPEGSSGTTQSSATNLPIPVWFPAEYGWPSMGTLTRDSGKTTYRVPSTPFPGLGLMFLSTNGDLTPLGPVTIAASENGAECRDAGECESGFCADGLCCDEACDGKCEACSRAKKGGGKDGECRPVAAGTPDDACNDDLRNCGENGTCNDAGQCALYPDGAECARDAACRGGQCIGLPASPNDDGNAGAAGAPNDPGTGATGGTERPRNTCNADQQLVNPDGALLRECFPFRCRDATCVIRCESTRDCVDGYGCDQGRCVTPVARRTTSVGCGCRMPRRSTSRDGDFLSLVVAAACLTRRIRRRPTRRSGA